MGFKKRAEREKTVPNVWLEYSQEIYKKFYSIERFREEIRQAGKDHVARLIQKDTSFIPKLLWIEQVSNGDLQCHMREYPEQWFELHGEESFVEGCHAAIATIPVDKLFLHDPPFNCQ